MGGNGHPARGSRQKSGAGAVRSVVFRGATKVTLDAKGRMAIPTRYRERLAARCDGEIVIRDLDDESDMIDALDLNAPGAFLWELVYDTT